MKYSLCDGWTFFAPWAGPAAQTAGGTPVRLPHTVGELPLHGAGPEHYEGVFGYHRPLELGPELAGKRLFLQFDGAAHVATVYVNGKQAATHRCGYTAFRVEITSLADLSGPNVLDVELDATEDPAVPPFGFAIDYLTYGGLYREVWLDVREARCIGDVFVSTPTLTAARVLVTPDPPAPGLTVEAAVLDGDRVLASASAPAEEGPVALDLQVPGAAPWDTDHPNLYLCRVTLKEGETVLDVARTPFGFRTAEWRGDGFYLNGRKTFLRGLDRHQCWPYVGYAVPAALQREDARILKEELGCNTVRTSHYPQSHHFLDACDALGLLVFTEIPGWQHIGDGPWQDQTVENVREMVLQYRNHPSIILWGVRINESLDNDGFYARTNALAHALDPTRSTSGVRNFEKSHLLEDVYAYNDFSYYEGENKLPAVKAKKDVTPDPAKALLISEHSGHMYPTKPYDDWPHRARQAHRHARILNDAMADGGHAGCLGWCMFDYPTHPDFGSGDRVCYHGVMDFFRNPKTAAAVYASQQDAVPVLEVASSMDIGDYPAGQVGPVGVFTNLPRVALYKNDVYVADLSPSGLDALPHPPLVADDTVGGLLETREGFPPKKAALVRECLVAAGKYGLANLPLKYKLKLAWCMLRHKMTYDDGVALYGKYIGNWGGKAIRWRFDGVRDGRVVASVTRGPSSAYHLEVKASHIALTEGDTYDMAAVRVRLLDEFGGPCPYLQLPVTFTLTGAARLVGPRVVTAEGGMCGTYLKTAGETGEASLTVSTPQTDPVTLTFTVA